MNSAHRSIVFLAISAALLLSACGKKPGRPSPFDTLAGQQGTRGNTGLDVSDVPLPPDLTQRTAADDLANVRRGVLPTVFFDFDSAAIRQAERAKLSQAVDYVRTNPGARLLLEGHCDWRGTEEYNIGLGDRRARAVKDFLGTLGVPASALETLSVGDHGAVEGGNEPQMQNDRRVEIGIFP
jgi:peptidoglycan-associated lipoprotein